MPKPLLLLGFFLCTLLGPIEAQDIELFQQFNGRFDYVAIGNTLNLEENGLTTPCVILSESSANLSLQPSQTVVAAVLYWAGPGDGDFEVELNDVPVTASRTFSYEFNNGQVTFTYFGAFADVTNIVTAAGSGTYNLSELDLNDAIQPYCGVNNGTGTNFGGWAMYVIYEDPALPLNQVALFDGMDGISGSNNEITIVLDNLDVLDNTGAKIGFLAWEGDAGIANNETLSINGAILSNALNPSNNQFNGTNSFTNSSELYNMDLDFYDIENNIQPGDTSAIIQATSNQDLVMIHNIITVLNTELPDATIAIDDFEGSTECGDRDLELDYTVFNVNSTAILPSGTPIGFFANNILLGTAETLTELAIDGSESGSVALTVPGNIPADFTLRAFVDHTDVVNELNEDNNEDTLAVHLQVFPEIVGLTNLELCDVVGEEFFDLTEATSQIDPVNTISYHFTEVDANNDENPIPNPEAFQNTENPQTIWIRVSNPDCFVVDSFTVEILICPLPDATVSIDNDIYACRQRDLLIEYTVYNEKGTAPLPAGTQVAFYINTSLLTQAETVNEIPIGGSEPGEFEVMLPESTPNTFELRAVVDDDGTGLGSVEELNEFNNEFILNVEFGELPPIPELPNLTECDMGLDRATFDFTDAETGLLDIITENSTGDVQFFLTQTDAILNVNPITNPDAYENITNPQTIYVRLENDICFTTASFNLIVEKCPPTIYEGLSPNGDGKNDVFNIKYIVNVYPDFELKVYSREGNLIYEGGNFQGLWNGIPNRGILQQDKVVPTGVYYYVLILNDPDFPEPFIGDIYVNY